ncbi:hypothetical protein Rhe02_11000 [Rhizocola hellebori]|uniref:Uncharacterized protein n=1 Tax=Rhizocola hellebori TaxID=1392758 RepID=A0A8J3Q324_9ACTN|nr:hypothetical protein [Rhizocola hellebori]GIH03033.1 hypothetical protein Rhe02_11000 [Rhizocola hellebori]
MKILRLASTIALAVVGGLLATAVPAQAASASFPFRADSGDNCRYGSTQGTLIWRYSSTAPIRPIAVEIRGTVIDHPIPNENFLCADDGFFTIASYTAFAGSAQLRQEARANNAVVAVSLTLGPSAPTTAGITRVTIQVCRHPLFGTRPSYCGVAQHYAPIVADPPTPSS